MLQEIVWSPSEGRKINCHNYNTLTEKRIGVMVHFDDSGSDESAMAWFEDPACHVSYNYLVLDDGSYVVIAPDQFRAWHAGVCASSDPPRLHYRDANSAFVGIAAATNDKVRATPEQHFTIAWLCRQVFERNHWPLTDVWRVTGHDAEAVYPQMLNGKPHPLAGKRGRKIDPTGRHPNDPIVSLGRVREYLARVR
ncbi:MAG TPA: N-acetylmuramoyl-L-alanine amidase [Longimicrobiales bacterium]